MDIHRFLWTEFLFIFLLLLTEKTMKSILKTDKKEAFACHCRCYGNSDS